MKLDGIQNKVIQYLDFEFYPASFTEIYAALNRRGFSVGKQELTHTIKDLLAEGVIEEMESYPGFYKKAWGETYILKLTKTEVIALKDLVSENSVLFEKIKNI